MVRNNPQAKTRKHHNAYEGILVVPIYEPIFSHCNSIGGFPNGMFPLSESVKPLFLSLKSNMYIDFTKNKAVDRRQTGRL